MDFIITFLGTSSGGGPSESRNCSCLIADVVGNGNLWMFDCAEGSIRQFSIHYNEKHRLQPNKLTKIFITHMHADHIMGIVPVLRNILYPPLAVLDPDRPPKIEIFGPAGIRTFVRSILKMTHTKTSDRYVVHELLTHTDPITPCGPSDLHSSELAGRDILCTLEDGLWRDISGARNTFTGTELIVDAGPIQHRDPCIGYVVRELTSPNRKLVILGDTFDPSGIIPLCAEGSPPSLLIHEATDTHIPVDVDFGLSKRSPETVLQKTLDKGHSTPGMAGAFARRISAERLVLNHIGGRFPSPRQSGDNRRRAIIREIEQQATKAWGTSGRRAIAAFDYMTVVIPFHEPETGRDRERSQRYRGQDAASNAGREPNEYRRYRDVEMSSPSSSSNQRRERSEYSEPHRHHSDREFEYSDHWKKRRRDY
ncbi:hypothetical protein HGRIS_013319 [Hohenbuehelia grisea]|uniref:Metallo-beta-lactamase domain-containing protein n=1 Tax=Hohenbuehelia grisea TaxID=104357 RepID=A0ABR3IV69_9AGAR